MFSVVWWVAGRLRIVNTAQLEQVFDSCGGASLVQQRMQTRKLESSTSMFISGIVLTDTNLTNNTATRESYSRVLLSLAELVGTQPTATSSMLQKRAHPTLLLFTKTATAYTGISLKRPHRSWQRP